MFTIGGGYPYYKLYKDGILLPYACNTYQEAQQVVSELQQGL